MSNNEEEPKIIVDEDWKNQVEAEKEAEPEAAEETGLPEGYPPPSLELLVSTMAAQAVVGLGLAPDPATQEPAADLNLAKFHIDMLSVLEEKTAGNRSPEEERILSEALHELRMLYVTVSKSPEQFSGPQDSGDEGPSIVTP